MNEAGQDCYITDPGRPRSFWSRFFLSPTFTFYPQIFSIVWRYSRMANRGEYPAERWAESSFEILRALENIGARFEIEGLNNIRAVDGPAVFIGNHMSTLETLVLPCIVQPLKPVTFVVKESLVTMPLFGPVMRSRDPVLVGRRNAREDLKVVLERGAEKLSRGQSIIIFPQSTRAEAFNPEEFNSLGIKLAARAAVPVLPFALKTNAWGIGKRIKDFGPIDVRKKIHFAFGAPLHLQGRGSDEHQQVISFISERLGAWGKEESSGQG